MVRAAAGGVAERPPALRGLPALPLPARSRRVAAAAPRGHGTEDERLHAPADCRARSLRTSACVAARAARVSQHLRVFAYRTSTPSRYTRQSRRSRTDGRAAPAKSAVKNAPGAAPASVDPALIARPRDAA